MNLRDSIVHWSIAALKILMEVNLSTNVDIPRRADFLKTNLSKFAVI